MESKIIKLPESGVRISPQNCKVYWKDNSKYGYVCSIILPTCSSKVFGDMFFGTIEHIAEMAPFATICLNLQGDGFNIEKIAERFDELGFSYRIMEGRYSLKDGCPFNRIVDDTCMIAPQNTKMFLRVDDDFIFSKKGKLQKKTVGGQYLSCIHYMLSHPKCGVIATNRINGTAFLSKHIITPKWEEYRLEDNKIKHEHRDLSWFDDFVWTCTGILLRNVEDKEFNVKGRTLPKTVVDQDWVYDGEDVLAAAVRLGLGYYIARTEMINIRHVCTYSASKHPDDDPRKWCHIWEDDEFGFWVRANLNYNWNDIEKSRFIVGRKFFKDKYGELLDKEKCLELKGNYREKPTSEVIEEIKEFLD